MNPFHHETRAWLRAEMVKRQQRRIDNRTTGWGAMPHRPIKGATDREIIGKLLLLCGFDPFYEVEER